MRRRLPVLLASRHVQVVAVVVRTDDQLECSGNRSSSDIDAERGVSAHVVADVVAVRPDVGDPVDAREVHDDAFGVGRRFDSNRQAVPTSLDVAIGADARRGRLGSERDDDRSVEVDLAGVIDASLAVERELPLAVERLPRSLEQWAGVVRGRDRGGHDGEVTCRDVPVDG